MKSEFQIKSEFKLVLCIVSGSLNSSGGDMRGPRLPWSLQSYGGDGGTE